jgi:Transposase DDE domain
VLLAAMTHRAPGQDAVVLGQVAVPEGTTETTQVRTLLDLIDITGALVTADAAHTCADTARYLVEDCGADYLLTIKGNRPALHAAAIATGRELIAAEPDHVTEDRGHGRINRWTTWAADTGEGLGLPYAARLALIRRDIADLAGQPLSKEIAFVVTSRAHLPAGEISAHTRQHWGIENLVHRPPRHRLARGRPPGLPRQRPPDRGHLPQPGPRPVRHPRHHQDQTERTGNRPQPHTGHPTAHIASRSSVSNRL